MTRYDTLAAEYDDHYLRPIDQAENMLLAEVLKPLVDGKRVLDLGCGTGLLLDLCEPDGYVGIDVSQPMLDRLTAKHPGVGVVHADLTDPDAFPILSRFGQFDIVTSLFAAHYLDLPGVLAALRQVAPFVFLHGSGPGNTERANYIAADAHGLAACTGFTPEKTTQAALDARWANPRCIGLNAYPDAYTAPLGPEDALDLIRTSIALPAAVSYHFALTAERA